MSNRPNLKPELHTDKNGKQSTRWVRGDTGLPKAKNGDISRVTKPLATSSHPEVTEHLYSSLYADVEDSGRAFENIKYLQENMPEVLEKIIAFIEKSPVTRLRMKIDLKYGEYDKEIARVVRENTLDTINIQGGALRVLQQTLTPDRFEDTQRMTNTLASAHSAIRTVTSVGKNKISVSETMAAAVQTAILVLGMDAYDTEELENIGYDVSGKDGGSMEDIYYMANNFDKVEPIIPLLIERGTFDRNVIDSLTTSEAPSAMLSGML